MDDLKGNIIALPGLEGHTPTHLTGLQVVMQPHVDVFVAMWWVVWCVTLIALAYRGWKSARQECSGDSTYIKS